MPNLNILVIDMECGAQSTETRILVGALRTAGHSVTVIAGTETGIDWRRDRIGQVFLWDAPEPDKTPAHYLSDARPDLTIATMGWSVGAEDVIGVAANKLNIPYFIIANEYGAWDGCARQARAVAILLVSDGDDSSLSMTGAGFTPFDEVILDQADQLRVEIDLIDARTYRPTVHPTEAGLASWGTGELDHDIY